MELTDMLGRRHPRPAEGQPPRDIALLQPASSEQVDARQRAAFRQLVERHLDRQ